MNKTILRINGKCDDCFFAELESDGKIIKEYDGGYPPPFLSGGDEGVSNCIILEIDVATGKIIGWNETKESILKSFEEVAEEEDED